MPDEIVCLECGKRVAPGMPASCACPPPSLAPPSLAPPAPAPSSTSPRSSAPLAGGGGPTSAPYRVAPPSAACPRCGERLGESTVHDALVLDCGCCGGVFVSRKLIEELDTPAGRHLRVAFPVRPRMPEPTVVRYLVCPVCGDRMNRSSFARGSQVIVDTCKEDGIWFDAGEVHAVIDFVEGGGLERAKRRAAQDRAAENERLRSEWRRVHEESMRETTLGRRHPHVSPEERALADAFFSWLRR